MSLVIHGIAASRAFRPLWAAEELGLPYTHVPTHYASEAVHSDAHLALNPNATVPVIEDDGLVLFESLAITLHLARRHRAGGLWVDDDTGQAHLLQWTLWAATEAEPPARQWFRHTQFLPAERRRPELAAEALEQMARPLRVLDQHLAGRPYLLGDRFTVADLNVAAVLQRLPQLGGAEGHPHALDWHQRCYARPAVARARSRAGGVVVPADEPRRVAA